MRRIQYHSYGGPETMRLEEFELPPLKATEVAVDVDVASVNPLDWKLRQGVMKILTGRSFPRAMGSDFAGVVRAVGSRVSRFVPGDPVFGVAPLRKSGAFAEAVITNESLLAHRPTELSVDQAACLPTVTIMAWQGLIERAGLRQGQRVFVNGCTGGVGEAAVQIAHMLGAEVIGSCGTSSMDRARQLGVHTLYDYADLHAAELTALKRVFDVVYDTAGTLPMKTALGMLTRTGILIDINAITPARFLRAAFVRGHKIHNRKVNPRILAEIAHAAVNGNLHISIGETVPLETAAKLIAELEKGRKIPGKALISMRGGQ